MTHYHLVFLGFGKVGQALARLLLEKQTELQSRYDLTFSVTGIATSHHGMAIRPDGIDLHRALELMQSKISLSSLAPGVPTNTQDFIAATRAEVLFETIPVNYINGQPALDYLRTALRTGMHAITANKGPVVFAYHELSELAKVMGHKFYFESAVMDGAPIFSLFRQALPAANITAFRGVLNSTTNLILTRMETGEDFTQAVMYAQSIGIAETDPSGDIDGWDAAVKVAALVTVLMGLPLRPVDVNRKGIRELDRQQILYAHKEGKRFKLICSAQRGKEGVIARVAPELVDKDSPFYGVNGTSSIVQFETDVLPSFSIIETDPEPRTTAYGLLADFINAVTQ
jgi:homoserine dehydrogenase